MKENMARRPYMQQPKDRSGWIFRWSIPLRYRKAAGATEWKRSLGSTFQEALERYPAVFLEFSAYQAELFRKAESEETFYAGSDNVPPVTYKILGARERRVLDHFLSSRVYTYLDMYDGEITEATEEALDALEAEQKEYLKRLQSAMRRMSPPEDWIEEIQGEMSNALAIRLHPDCLDRRDFFLRALDTEIKSVNALLKRLRGEELVLTPQKPAQPVAAIVAAPIPTGPTLLDAFNAWANVRTRSGGGKTDNEYRGFAERFGQFVCGFPLEQVGLTTISALTRERQVGREWIEHVARSQGVEYKTLRKYKSALSTIFQLAVENGKTDVNPFTFKLANLQLRGTNAEVRKGNKAGRSPLPAPLVERYFNGPLFSGPGFDRRMPPPVAYWFPLILRFTGARPLEVSFLMRDDIVLPEDYTTPAHQLAGHGNASWIYFYSDVPGVGGQARPIKTGVSLRRMPIPEILLKLGFTEYIRSVSRGQWLFPMQVSADNPANRARYALNALGDYLRTTLDEQNPLYVTYSFRHNVVDEAREAGVEQEVRDALLGHTEGDNRSKNAGETFYGARWYPGEPLREAAALLASRHQLPQSFPRWEDYRSQAPDFSGVVRAPRALPLKRRSTNIDI
ncbi:phage integrase [Caballeronia calidae]|uniref:Phage integrase n=1 Tax=Caballeronia calidae TaxID=1777139 RepID=A0A158EHD3_9BURK|nr:hypothetical protein [Caballeronia calidae]SAL06224.1 phage integrase [Caballeronia calidae]